MLISIFHLIKTNKMIKKEQENINLESAIVKPFGFMNDERILEDFNDFSNGNSESITLRGKTIVLSHLSLFVVNLLNYPRIIEIAELSKNIIITNIIKSLLVIIFMMLVINLLIGINFFINRTIYEPDYSLKEKSKELYINELKINIGLNKLEDIKYVNMLEILNNSSTYLWTTNGIMVVILITILALNIFI